MIINAKQNVLSSVLKKTRNFWKTYKYSIIEKAKERIIGYATERIIGKATETELLEKPQRQNY